MLSALYVSAADIGKWEFDFNSNNTAYDSIGNNDGNLVGAEFASDSRMNSYVKFDGLKDYVKINDSDELDGFTKFTWNMWVKQTDYKDGAVLLGKYAALTGYRSYYIKTSLTDSISIVISNETKIESFTSSSIKDCGVRNNNEWTMITVTYDGSRIIYYRNGVKCDEDFTSIKKIANSKSNLNFGTGNNIYFNGSMDDVAVYNSVLDSEQVMNLYNPDSEKSVSVKLADKGDQVKVVDSDAFKGYKQATWNMWVKQDEYVDRAGLFGKYKALPGYRSFLLRTVLGNGVSVVISNGTHTGLETSTSYKKCGIRNNNEWTMITVTYDGSRIEYYRNGVKCDEDFTNVNRIGDSKSELTFGTGNSVSFQGNIDDYKIYNKKLTAEQVKRLYDESSHGKYLGQSITSLLYHQVTENADARDKVDVDNFEKQMAYLKSAGFTPISAKDYNNWKNNNFDLPKKPIMVTFDDGWGSVYNKAYPIMTKYNMKGTVFINSAYADQSEGAPSYMTWEELKTLHNNGWDMQSHGINHVNMLTLNEDQFRRQLVNSKTEISSNLGVTPTSFVFPFHSADQEYTTMCGEYYDLCWTRGTEADKPIYNYKLSNGKLYNSLRRITVASYTTLDTFKNLLGRDTDIKGEWQMNEGGGEVTQDSSGNDNDGTLVGATWSS